MVFWVNIGLCYKVFFSLGRYTISSLLWMNDFRLELSNVRTTDLVIIFEKISDE